AVLTTLTGTYVDRLDHLVESLPLNQLQPGIVDGNLLSWNSFRSSHSDGDAFTGPWLPLRFPESFPILVVDDGNARQLAMPYRACIQDPGLVPGDSPIPGGSLKLNLGMRFQCRVPFQLSHSGFHVDEHPSIGNMNSGSSYRFTVD